MEAVKRPRCQAVLDQAVEVVLIVVCFAASVYGLALLELLPALF